MKKTLNFLLEDRAESTPERLAYLYLGPGGVTDRCTYAELRLRSHAVAARLLEASQPGERVLLLFPPGLDFIHAFLACSVAGTIAVPAPAPNPLKPARSLSRLEAIVRSARPTWALTTSEVLGAIRPVLAEHPQYACLHWLAVDELPDRPGAVTPRDHETALIQYTSGSTADPKGATLSQENVLHNLAYFDQGWEHGPESVGVNWLPAFHDLGLVYGILNPLAGGYPGVQLSPIEVIQRPFSWLKAITEQRATHSAGPNFIYELALRKVRDEEITRLDLSRWKVALTAAEPIHAETLTRFAARFAPAGFRLRTFSPGYGLSEGTCKVVAVPCTEEPTVLSLRDEALEQHRVELCPPGRGARTVVGCGRPGGGVGIAIVDPETKVALDPGNVGEIWVSGPSVATSYWERPEATAELLQARLAGEEEVGTPYLRTGDYGFCHEGQLYVTGRLKDMIIVRGSNHYPQDLEYTAQQAHPAIRPGCVAAFAVEQDGEERVVVVAEVDLRRPEAGSAEQFAAEEVVACIRQAVSEEHGLRVQQVALIRPGTLPKTTSGKVQRQQCKKDLQAGKLASIGG